MLTEVSKEYNASIVAVEELAKKAASKSDRPYIPEDNTS
jgi:hypothetical protein